MSVVLSERHRSAKVRGMVKAQEKLAVLEKKLAEKEDKLAPLRRRVQGVLDDIKIRKSRLNIGQLMAARKLVGPAFRE